MTSVPSSLTTGFNPAASSEKLEAWNTNKHKNLRDTILKVVAIVGLVLLGCGGFAAGIAVPILLPTLPVAAVLALTFSAPTLFAFSNTGAMVLGFMTDWNNYRDPDQVIKTLADLKSAKTPHPVSTYERLHRYGIISKHELGRRKVLENSFTKYKQVVSELNNKTQLIVSKDAEITRLALMPSMAARYSELIDEAKTLTDLVGVLDNQKSKLEEEFKRFHDSIVDFDPHSS